MEKTQDCNELFDAFLSALTLEWSDNGNIMAAAVRDRCVTVLAQVHGISAREVEELVKTRIESLQ